MQRMPGMRQYLIRLDHGYDGDTEEIEFEALGAEIAISRLETIPNKRRAVIFEDGQQFADLSYMEDSGGWRQWNDYRQCFTGRHRRCDPNAQTGRGFQTLSEASQGLISLNFGDTVCGVP